MNTESKNKLQLVIGTIVASLSMSAFAYASESTGHGTSLSQWFWLVVNFAIFAFILLHFLKKPAIEFFKRRTEMIEAGLNEAKQAKLIAEKALYEIEENLRLKDDEIARIISSAKELGAAEKERLISEGKVYADKLIELSENNIAVELKRAKEELKDMAVEEAIELAEKRMKEKIDKALTQNLFDNAIAKIGAKN
ncbi:MAG: ATP synthase F0 subunit B [Nitrospirae bacterium]|nr:ATP synthase F0 subunit B [Nitrospirota bacterium]